MTALRADVPALDRAMLSGLAFEVRWIVDVVEATCAPST